MISADANAASPKPAAEALRAELALVEKLTDDYRPCPAPSVAVSVET